MKRKSGTESGSTRRWWPRDNAMYPWSTLLIRIRTDPDLLRQVRLASDSNIAKNGTDPKLWYMSTGTEALRFSLAQYSGIHNRVFGQFTNYDFTKVCVNSPHARSSNFWRLDNKQVETQASATWDQWANTHISCFTGWVSNKAFLIQWIRLTD